VLKIRIGTGSRQGRMLEECGTTRKPAHEVTTLYSGHDPVPVLLFNTSAKNSYIDYGI
jgi:hypothetical protein